ncbi:hypothetical protein [Streptomyces sp. NPDC051016]|uniref:zinc finger domain-containing protein n=1 Tax=Streptomyces sp. NPDC051016 TaxID=3365638 RepID=UPI00379F335F
MATTDSSPRSVDCPPPPEGCAATAGEPCFSHGGTRERRLFHQVRTAAWQAARIAAVPAAKLVADAVAARKVRHGKHAAELLVEKGYMAEAERVRQAVSEQHGHMSGKQSVALLVEIAEAGGTR